MIPTILTPRTTPCLRDRSAIEAWFLQHFEIQGTYTISDNGQIDVVGNVHAIVYRMRNCRALPVTFNSVTGWFKLTNCQDLKTLFGSPKTVGGSFHCSGCDSLLSLEGAPRYVGGEFYSYHCDQLRTLKGAPDYVGGSFHAYTCLNLTQLACTNLTVGENMHIQQCGKIATISDIGIVKGIVHISDWSPITKDIVLEILHSKLNFAIRRVDVDPVWFDMVRDYNATGDLIQLCASFEDYFNEPFGGLMPPSQTVPMELPSL